MALLNIALPAPEVRSSTLLSAGLTTASDSDFDMCYEIQQELGRGAMSVVYAATSKQDGSIVAVKVLQKRQLFDGQPRAPERLRDEMRALAALRHPSIVTLHETFEDDEDLLIITERADGGELFDRIVEHGSFTEPHAQHVMRQLLGAVSYMHSKVCVAPALSLLQSPSCAGMHAHPPGFLFGRAWSIATSSRRICC
tara:strand:- start:467 stop:1057 length:591 start_codon:yes stop_codon:yes gene_type:complete